MQKIDAVIRVHFKENPEELSDEDWAKRLQEWVYVNRVQNNAQERMFEKTFRKVLFEVVSEVFKALNKKPPPGRKGK